MSPEQTKQAQRQHAQRRATAEARYVAALQALALREAEFFALDRIDAGAAAKLEALGAREKAAARADEAQREVINAAWSDGTLADAVQLGEAVRAMLAGIAADARSVAQAQRQA